MSLDRDLANFLWLGLGGAKKVTIEEEVIDPAVATVQLGSLSRTLSRVFVAATADRNQKRVE